LEAGLTELRASDHVGDAQQVLPLGLHLCRDCMIGFAQPADIPGKSSAHADLRLFEMLALLRSLRPRTAGCIAANLLPFAAAAVAEATSAAVAIPHLAGPSGGSKCMTYNPFCPLQDAHRSSLKVRKPPGGGSSIVFGDPNEHISLQYRNADDEPIKIIGV